MSFRLLKLCCGAGLAVVGGVAVCCAQTEPKATHGRALELSEPTAKEAITNLNQLTGRSGLQQLEDELSKSLHPFSARSSLEGVVPPQYIPPPAVPATRSRKLKDELERRQNWMFLSPDDMLPGMDDAELLKVPEPGSDQQKKKTPFEQFYERLEREQKAMHLKNSSDENSLSVRARSRDDANSQEDAKLPGGVRDNAQNLRKLLNDDSTGANFDGGNRRGTLSDLFGLGDDRRPTKQDLEKHKAYMDEYRKVLAGSVAAQPSIFDPVKAATTATPTTTPNLNGLIMPTPHLGSDMGLGALGTVFMPSVLPDPNATVLNQWNPFYNPQQKADPPKPSSFSVPMPEAPRRKF